jgi:hypothetical protein
MNVRDVANFGESMDSAWGAFLLSVLMLGASLNARFTMGRRMRLGETTNG